MFAPLLGLVLSALQPAHAQVGRQYYIDDDTIVLESSSCATVERAFKVASSRRGTGKISVPPCSCVENVCQRKIPASWVEGEQKIHVRYKEDGSTRLIGSNCSELNIYRQNLSKWSEKISSSPSCECTKRHCALSVTDVLPDLVRKYQGIWPAEGNCFNMSLILNGYTECSRQIDGVELDDFLKPPLCELRRAPPKIGDIVVVRRRAQYKSETGNGRSNNTHSHSFIYLGAKLGFEKPAMWWEQGPPAFIDPAETLKQYSVDRRDQYVVDPDRTDRGNPDDRVAAAYKCRDLNKWILESDDQKLKSSYRQVVEFECQAKPMSGVTDRNLIQSMTQVLDMIAEAGEHELRQMSAEEQIGEKAFLWKTTLARLSIVRTRVQLMPYSAPQ